MAGQAAFHLGLLREDGLTLSAGGTRLPPEGLGPRTPPIRGGHGYPCLLAAGDAR